jgi:hypothetical protein
MKITVWTSFSSGRPQTSTGDRVYPADGFLPSADAVKTASARAQVPTGVDLRGPVLAQTWRGRGSPRAQVRRPVVARPRGHGGAEFRDSPIKEGALLLFPNFQPKPVE